MIYYDQINLLKLDYIDSEKKYRCYSRHQLYVLRFIITLKNSVFMVCPEKNRKENL
ncbi:hypothetical protein [Psychrilyobacter sp.]|uniref:hypothetical protein n=1 Tax=Psychrilyobacter sp. TaxID=2586924 RepID=UPI003C7212C7